MPPSDETGATNYYALYGGLSSEQKETRRQQLEQWLIQAREQLAKLRHASQPFEVDLDEDDSSINLQNRLTSLAEDISDFELQLIALNSDNSEKVADQAAKSHEIRQYLAWARQHLVEKNYQLALSNYNRILAKTEAELSLVMQARIERAEIYQQLGDWPAALADYEAVRPTYPVRANLGLAIAHYYLGQVKMSLDYLRETATLAQASGNLTALLQALSYRAALEAEPEQANLGVALDLCEQAIALAEEHNLTDATGLARLYFNRAKIHQSLGDYPQAIMHYNQSLDIARAIGDKQAEGAAYGNLGNAYQSLGNYPPAIAYYNQSLDIARAIGDKLGESNVYAKLSLAHRDSGNLSQALQAIRQAVELEPTQPAFKVTLGSLLLRLDRFDEAKQYYTQAVAEGWQEANVYDGLGLCCLAAADYDQARARFEQATKLDPNSAASWGNLGAVLFRLDQLELARAAYAKAVATRQGDGQLVEELWHLALDPNLNTNTAVSERWRLEEIQAKLEAGLFAKNYHNAEYQAAILLSSWLVDDDSSANTRQAIGLRLNWLVDDDRAFGIQTAVVEPLANFYYGNVQKYIAAR